MRRTLWMIATFAIVIVALSRHRSGRIEAHDLQPRSETVLSEWRYPGSSPLGSGSAGGEAKGGRVKSIFRAHASMATTDAPETVVKYYEEKRGVRMTPSPANPAQLPEKTEAISVADDSRNRPLKLLIVQRDREDESITLVISRADAEKRTHIYFSITSH